MENTDNRLPSSLSEHLSRTGVDDVHAQSVPVNSAWWEARLDPRSLALHSPVWPGGEIRRSDLFALAENQEDEYWAERLLWNTLAWGTGRRARNNGQRIKSVTGNPEARKILQDAALASRDEPDDAFECFKTGHGRNTFPYLGPAFFTKYMYFAGAGRPSHSSVIVDQYVLKTLHQETGSADFVARFNYGRRVYRSAIGVLSEWAAAASEQLDRKVELDEIEYWAFLRGRG